MDYFPNNLTFSTINGRYDVLFQTADGDLDLKGTFGHLRKLIIYGLRARFKHLNPADRQFGKLVEAKSVRDIPNMVKTGRADVGLLFGTPQRIGEVDLTEPFSDVSHTFATDLPQALPKIYSYVYPFDLASWLCILVSVLSMAVLFYISNSQKSSTFSGVLLSAFGNVFSQPDTGVSHDRTVTLVLWRFFCFVVRVAYAAVLLSFLTVPRFERPPTTFRELARAIEEGRYCAYTNRGNFVNHLLKTSGKEHLVYIEETIRKNEWCLETKEHLDINDIKRAYVSIRPVLNFVYGKPPLSVKYISEDNEFSVPASLVLNKRFCCKRDLDLVIRRIGYSGLYDKHVKDELFKRWIKIAYNSSSRRYDEPLTLNDLSGAFYVILIGYVFSFFVFILELVREKLRLVRERYKGSLKFVR